MKRTIKLTENDLHKIIEESVKNVINESIVYGSIEPFQRIANAASELMERYEYVTEEDYEPWDDCDGKDLAPGIYQWAEKILEDANYYIQNSSSNSPINGGERW